MKLKLTIALLIYTLTNITYGRNADGNFIRRIEPPTVEDSSVVVIPFYYQYLFFFYL